jgi:hypothetical protein
VRTRHDDELAVPHFHDRLWHELEKEHGSLRATEPAAPARLVRRRRTLVATAAAVVAVGGAVAGLVLLAGGDEPTTSIAPAAESTTTNGATSSETSRPDAVVMIEHRNAEGHVHRSWVDEQTGRKRDLDLDAAGDPEWDSGWLSLTEVGDELVIATREVDHCFREYQDAELRVPIETARQALPDDWRVESLPGAIVEDGSLVAEGTEIVDGRELLRYRDVANDGVVWVDPRTHDFVKQRYSVGSDAEQTTTYEYLARTPDNLAVLEPQVPPGFTTPRSPHTDEERVAAGCG